MQFIDTHTHLFLPEFDDDRASVIKRALDKQITKMVLPNVDLETLEPLKKMALEYPENCYPLLGLHPGSVNAQFESALAVIEKEIEKTPCLGIGEIGIDLYWDKTFREEQIEAFEIQVQWAKQKKLPIIIHLRNSYDDVVKTVQKHLDGNLTGIFHCFTGNLKQAEEIMDMGFLMGIGGILTFKNSGLSETIQHVDPNYLVLETDSPYLAPVPYRGKRNESSYLVSIAEKLADIYQIPLGDLAKITTENAERLLKFTDNKTYV